MSVRQTDTQEADKQPPVSLTKKGGENHALL